MREAGTVEGALPTKHEGGSKNKGKKNKQNQQGNGEGVERNNKSKGENSKKKYPPCKHCNKLGHPPFKCWRRPDAKCSKCNQLGHEAIICKKQDRQQEGDAKIANEEEDELFVAETCFASNASSDCSLIDSGCTNHVTFDKTLFKELHSSKVTRIRIGNGGYISAKGVGTVAITTPSGTKTISNVLYVPDINQSLLSVGQLLEKGFKVFFEDSYCLIYDAAGKEIFKVKMRGKSFSYDPKGDE